MWFFSWCMQMLGKPLVGATVLGLALAMLLVAVLTIATDSKLLFPFCSALVGGSVGLVLLAGKVSARSAYFCWALFACVCALCGLLSLYGCHRRQIIRQRRKKRAEILRKLQFTLPDKENDFVRSRLQTALQAQGVNSPQMSTGNEKQEENTELFRLEYVKKLLTKLKNAPLTKAERLEMDEMTKLLSAYLKKSKWTSEDVRVVNELFSCLLKLSAKYAV